MESFLKCYLYKSRNMMFLFFGELYVPNCLKFWNLKLRELKFEIVNLKNMKTGNLEFGNLKHLKFGNLKFEMRTSENWNFGNLNI